MRMLDKVKHKEVLKAIEYMDNQGNKIFGTNNYEIIVNSDSNLPFEKTKNKELRMIKIYVSHSYLKSSFDIYRIYCIKND